MGMDQFGTEFKFRMPDGRTKHKTCIGVLMTLILFSILITFIVYRLNDMRQGPIVIESTEEDYFDIDTIFRSDDEVFKFAFGIFSTLAVAWLAMLRWYWCFFGLLLSLRFRCCCC